MHHLCVYLCRETFGFVLLRSSWRFRVDILQPLINTLCPVHKSASLHVWCSESSWFGSSGWWYPWATNSWSKSWGIIHKICYWAVPGTDNQEKTPISPGAAVLVLLSRTAPRINHCQTCQGIMRNWWSLQKALPALPVASHAAMAGPCQEKHFAKDPAFPPLCSSQIRINALWWYVKKLSVSRLEG